MNICGIALGCLILALGALLAYIGMAALMEMWLGADSTSLNVLCGVKYPSDFDRHSFLSKKYLNSAGKKLWACWGVQRQAVAPTLLYSRIVLDPEQAGFWGFGMLQWMQWMQWVLSEALIWCFHPHYAGPTLDAMLFVYGNGACVRDFTCLGSVVFSYFTLDPKYVSRFEVGYMVFIGDFVPPILALLFPEEEWAKETQGSLAWRWKFWNQQMTDVKCERKKRCKPTEIGWTFWGVSRTCAILIAAVRSPKHI